MDVGSSGLQIHCEARCKLSFSCAMKLLIIFTLVWIFVAPAFVSPYDDDGYMNFGLFECIQYIIWYILSSFYTNTRFRSDFLF